ncbi:hypothetical protein SNEBB_002738 [Seison nebaliae]|nr:hypothetical protein SNEBB_002738 [Seison nebaliae]
MNLTQTSVEDGSPWNPVKFRLGANLLLSFLLIFSLLQIFLNILIWLELSHYSFINRKTMKAHAEFLIMYRRHSYEIKDIVRIISFHDQTYLSSKSLKYQDFLELLDYTKKLAHRLRHQRELKERERALNNISSSTSALLKNEYDSTTYQFLLK